MREVELKGVVADVPAARAALEAAGATCSFTGALHDRRYDTPARALRMRDEVLRLRVMRAKGGDPAATLDFKGPASYPGGFKVREEVSTTIGDADELGGILKSLGFVVSREIERTIEVWHLEGATVRFEAYPRMDVLAEVEGEPSAIERAIEVMGLRRADFTCERIADFAYRFEVRTGNRAALSLRELYGDYTVGLDDA